MENKKSYTLQELADEYNVTQRTLYAWIRPIRQQIIELNPVRQNRLRVLTPKQIKFLKKYLG
jgi:predicted DNA-binding protein YlxM (UPF0122 family)